MKALLIIFSLLLLFSDVVAQPIETDKTQPTGTIVGTTDTQTLTNKDLSNGNTFPSSLVTLTDVQTLTSKTLTDPKISIMQVNGSSTGPLLAGQVSNAVIYNTGQGPNVVTLTLPTETYGLYFHAIVGEAQAASTWKLSSATSGAMCLDGTCGKNFVAITAPTQGAEVGCKTVVMASTGIKSLATLAMATDTLAVKNEAFSFDITGTGYAKVAVDGTALAAGTIPQDKWGIYLYSVQANGTITSTAAVANFTTGYDSEALAIAALPSTPGSNTNMGYVTVMTTGVAGFIGGTTALNGEGVTAHYTNTYYWNCKTLIGTWVTN
jgi:hypothetical protein